MSALLIDEAGVMYVCNAGERFLSDLPVCTIPEAEIAAAVEAEHFART